MSQTPHPHDPFGTAPGTPAPAPQTEQPEQSAPAVPSEHPEHTASTTSELLDVDAPAPYAPSEPGSPTSDPAQHPYDPYAAPAGATPVAPGSSATPPPHGRPPHEQPPHEQQPYGQQPAAQQPSGSPQHPTQYPAPQAQTVPGGTMPLSQPPAHVKGVFDGPLTGQPTTDSDSRLWAMFAQLSAIVGYVIGAGFLGWLGPLIIFLVYKDRDRFVRYNAAESLNAAIATVIAEIVLGIVFGIITIITFGIGSVLFVLIGVPALLHIIFAIIGAVKANQGEWWNYPINIRLVK